MYEILKKCLRTLLRCLYRVEVHGLEHYHQAGAKVLIISNHVSFLDPLLLGVFLPDKITFAINTHISQQAWLRPFLGLSHIFPMDPTHPLSLKALIHYMKEDHKTVIFPEGRISVTGSLMKIYDGTGIVADKTGAAILPIRIEGAQYTPFSRLKGKVRLRWLPKISLQILPAVKIHTDENLHGRCKRQVSGRKLADLMNELIFATAPVHSSLFEGLLAARKIHGGKHLIVEDLERQPLSYHDLVSRCFILANALKTQTEIGEFVGVLLPNSTKTVLVILGLQIHQRVPAMLNYSVGAVGIIAACQLAKIKRVLTSRKFIDLAHLGSVVEPLAQQVQLIYLEDLAAQLSVLDKLTAFWQARTTDYRSPRPLSPNQPAVVLFTSGSEGSPKGVVLSHQNILANIHQVQARLNFTPQDIILNFLPLFHSFGFTAGTMLPLLTGMRTFFYPSPLHYSVIPELAYEINATILFATNTFLAAYGKKAHPYDFFNLRYVIAGAEKLQANTRALWQDKFGLRILEGYGATETSPIVSTNTPLEFKLGSVGRLMPAMRYQLEPIAGIESGGQLHLAGPNIMLGYLLADQAGIVIPTQSRYGAGWYDTGDIVEVDSEGFIFIKGRSKRFAKIGGEMVSLTMIEHLAIKAWPNALHAAINITDAKKGEQIVLLTTQTDAKLSQLTAANPGIAALYFPRKLLIVNAIPVLASGKTDYSQIMVLWHNQTL
jgi:acyl-[acyl-carrier-protein]-phospholipid O-acyltransferase/long-chain-fatty-acid--[acyl-carrier-protein] ligase